MRCDQSSSFGAASAGTPIKLGDDGDRDRRREIGDDLAGPPRLRSVDRRMGEFGDARRQPLDLARDESATDERAQARVLGRLEFEQRMALDRVERREMRRGARGQPSSSRVATWRICRPKRRSRSSAETSAWRAKHRIRNRSQKKTGVARANFAIGGIGVDEKGGIARIQRHAAVARRRRSGPLEVRLSQHIGRGDEIGPAADRFARREQSTKRSRLELARRRNRPRAPR